MKDKTPKKYKSAESKARAIANLKRDGSPTHGMTKTPVYISWANMKSRCDNPKNKSYQDYGQRKITYPPSWKDFQNFYNDIGYLWKEGLTLDRIDVNGNYCKENCKWSSRYEQSINKTNTNLLEHDGKVMTITDWAKYLGKNRSTLAQRFYVYKWSIEDTLLR